jgi:hypothetical protein
MSDIVKIFNELLTPDVITNLDQDKFYNFGVHIKFGVKDNVIDTVTLANPVLTQE